MTPADDRRYTPDEIAAVARWREWPDPVRPPATDEEPWLPANPDSQRGLSLLDAFVVLTAWWVYLTAAVSAALAVVLLLLGIRRARS